MDDFNCQWMLIGGIAAALLGKPRFTLDVDAVALVEDEDVPKFLKTAEKYNLMPRINDAENFARKNRVLLLKHTPSGIGLDISLGLLSFEIDAIKHSQLYKIGNLELQLPQVEDLIIFKAVAHRPQDMLDIQEILKVHPKVDKKYLKKNLQEFANILEIPGIWDDIKGLI